MNRDHLLFLLGGLLVGFLLGYVGHEAMDDLQPVRIAAGAVAPRGPGVSNPAVAPAGQGAPAGGPMGGNNPAAGSPMAGNPMEEINRLRERLEKNPDDVEALLQMANLNFDIQRWDRAAELYQKYLERFPGDPDVLTDLGITFRARGEFDRALELFREAQGKSPEHWQARFNEVVVLAFDRKDFAAAERALGALQSQLPDNADVARLAEEVRRRKEAG